MLLTGHETLKYECNDVLLEARKFAPFMDPTFFNRIFQVSLS